LDRLNSSAKFNLQNLLNMQSAPRSEELDLAVRELLLTSPIKKDQAALQALSVGQGAWEVRASVCMHGRREEGALHSQ